MKYTILTKEIDGHHIITGFGERSIEPMFTKSIVAKEIVKTDEFKAAKSKQGTKDAHIKMAGASSKKSNEAKAARKSADADKHHKDMLTFLEQAKGAENELKALLPAVEKKRQSLSVDHAVYFEPKAGEIPKSDAEIQALRDVIDSLNGSGYVDIDGNVIEDNRGAVYCQESGSQWSITKITMIGVGVPVDAILYSELDEAQKKAVDLQIEINIALSLSGAEKIAARERDESKAVNDSYVLRSQLEIQQVPDALEQSQEFYQSRMAEIEVIYG